MFDIEKCWMCCREDSSITGSCSINYFYRRIKYIENVKDFIVRVFNAKSSKDKSIYLQKSIEYHFPQYIKLYNTISLLY